MNINVKTFNEVESLYKSLNAWGILSSLDIRGCNPEDIRSKDKISEYVIAVCDLIGMQRFGDPQIVHFGEDKTVEGYSMTQLIETSLISGHFANLTNNAYIDIFSCKVYDPYLAAEFSKDFFNADDVVVNVLFRK
jgi:S-adenosylmethionine/arginine decarboxylase-like enzyme